MLKENETLEVVQKIDEVFTFGRAHVEGVYSKDYYLNFEINRQIDQAITRAGADAITNVEMTYSDLQFPNGLTLSIPVKTNLIKFLNGWIGVPVLGVYLHVVLISLKGDLVKIRDVKA